MSLSDNATRLLATLTDEPTRDLIVLRDRLSLSLCRDVAAAMDELHAAGLIRIARNGRLTVRSTAS